MTNTLRNLCLAAAFAGLALSSATGASAQGPMRGQMPSDMPGMGMMERGMGMMRMMAECPMMMGGDMATYAEGRVAFLKAELAISDAQKAAWDGYAAALTKNLQAMQGTRQKKKADQLLTGMGCMM